jgi:hypothetical protein
MAKQLDRWYCTFHNNVTGKLLNIITLQPPKVTEKNAATMALKQADLLMADVTLKLSARLYDK